MDPTFELIVDHVQGDPYASPSRFRAQISTAAAGIPEGIIDNAHK